MNKETKEVIELLKSLELEDVNNIVYLSNFYIEELVANLHPQKYENKRDQFIQVGITGPAIIAATIIDKISGTFHFDREKIIDEFIKKLRLSLRWVDHKNKDKQ